MRHLRILIASLVLLGTLSGCVVYAGPRVYGFGFFNAAPSPYGGPYYGGGYGGGYYGRPPY